MNDYFGDLFGRDFSASPGPGRNRSDLNAEKGVAVRGRDIDGAYYVRLDDVVALLKLNDVLPKAAAKFKTFLDGRA